MDNKKLTKKSIKQIDILVFPFFAGGMDIRNGAGARKFEQWVKNMEHALKNEERAFVVLRHKDSERRDFLGDKKKRKQFLRIQKGLEKKGLLFLINNPENELHHTEIVNHFSKRNLNEKIQIRIYGQHLGAKGGPIGNCVRVHGESLSKKILSELRAKGKKAIVSSIGPLSIKGYRYLPNNTSYSTQADIILREAKRKGLFRLRKLINRPVKRRK